MVLHTVWVALLACWVLSGLHQGDLIFRCPSCTAERQAACPRLVASCVEMVREPGCGCCPVCARLEGELCGVYTPRCSTGLRCYPSADSVLPLEQLVKGLGRCSRKVDLEPTAGQEYLDASVEVPTTDSPVYLRPPLESSRLRGKAAAVLQYHNDIKTRMKINCPEIPRGHTQPQSPCQQELSRVLEHISRMTFQDNRGLLENLYKLKFPNCDKHGHYNLKQCNMSTHGQRGECWCVDPVTGLHIPTSPRVRGDPNCSMYLEEQETPPTPALLQE
ncbi:insulin-like growth factor-binding protein 2-B [Hypomesus transpacificus]|uniref:insulin-like growth factor-binding protein 2-B n=1 Tax=Hypomesus transpacificus TaxID=137520 RepID=UPI001F087757|nr:insulin-like growth factor-binding protein 2-B [Hypomesus transpacificus]